MVRSIVRTAFVALGATIATVGLLATPAAAHEPGTSSLEIQLADDGLVLQLDLPVEELGQAIDEEIADDLFGLSVQRDSIAEYVTDRLLVADDAGVWTDAVEQITVVTVDGSEYARVLIDVRDAAGTPGSDAIADSIDLSFDGLVEIDTTHQIIVTLVGPDADGAAVVGVLDADTATLSLTDGIADLDTTVFTMAHHGYEHVLEGADHVLFLIVLLLPASLVVADGRWRPGDHQWSAFRRVVHVATAFTIGHSLTLIASALGWVSLPSSPVEVVIGLSVGVSAVHAIRPLAARGEAWIAGSFGLVHGLAFAGIIEDLGLSSSTSLWSLLGFNLGVELAQLAVIALVFPSLWLVSRTRFERPVGLAAATVALTASIGWILERVGIVDSPLAGIESAVIEHPSWFVGALALIAAVSTVADRAITERSSAPVAAGHPHVG